MFREVGLASTTCFLSFDKRTADVVELWHSVPSDMDVGRMFSRGSQNDFSSARGRKWWNFI